jgi:hypothetical protein
MFEFNGLKGEFHIHFNFNDLLWGSQNERININDFKENLARITNRDSINNKYWIEEIRNLIEQGKKLNKDYTDDETKNLLFQSIEKIHQFLLEKTYSNYFEERALLNRFPEFKELWEKWIELANFAYNLELPKNSITKYTDLINKRKILKFSKQINAGKLALIAAEGSYLMGDLDKAFEWIEKMKWIENIDNPENVKELDSVLQALRELVVDFWRIKGLIQVKRCNINDFSEARKFLGIARQKALLFWGEGNRKDIEIAVYVAKIGEDEAKSEDKNSRKREKYIETKENIEKLLNQIVDCSQLIPKLVYYDSLARISFRLGQLSSDSTQHQEAQKYYKDEQTNWENLLNIAESQGNVTCKYLALEALTNSFKKDKNLPKAYEYGSKVLRIEETIQTASKNLLGDILDITDDLIDKLTPKSQSGNAQSG